jgi:hypothetical protein
MHYFVAYVTTLSVTQNGEIKNNSWPAAGTGGTDGNHEKEI